LSAKILCFAGSARKASLNKKLAKVCAELIENQAAEATFIDLRDYPMPLYDGDLESESGIPENATKIRKLLAEHDGFVIACPEYNSSITPLLKNTIDWISRDGGIAEAFRGKVGALVSASPSWRGGLRGLVTVRSIFGNIGVYVIPAQFMLTHADKAFDDEGKLTDSGQVELLEKLVKQLVETARKLNS